MRRLLPLIAFGALALLLLAGVLASRDPDRDAIASPLIGKPAPAFALPVYGQPVGSSRVDLQACKLEYSIVSPK